MEKKTHHKSHRTENKWLGMKSWAERKQEMQHSDMVKALNLYSILVYFLFENQMSL